MIQNSRPSYLTNDDATKRPNPRPSEGAGKMKALKLFAPLAVALGLMAAPSVASAQDAGAVHSFLRGPLINPAAATLHIVPPAGGQVMIHRDGKAARWFVQPGLLTV